MPTTLKPSYDETPTAIFAREKSVQNVKRLIWVYFALLILEGSLRKWVLPRFSDILLVVRDPVVVAIYFFALKARLFPRNNYIFSLAIIGLLSWLVALVVLSPYIPFTQVVLVSGFGFRSNFLHLPLIFVIGAALTPADVKKLGRWVLLGMIPMALLMASQFNASPESFINRTAGLGDNLQITAGVDKIRPAGTFSFVSGVIYYSALASAYLLYGSLNRGAYRNSLLYSAGFSLIVAIGVSGSRSVLLAVLIVLSSLVAIILIRPRAINQFGRNLLIVVTALVVASQLPVVKQGARILSERFTATAEAEESSIAGGLIARTTYGFTEGLGLLGKAPIGGYGLGIGTNGGAKFLTGRTMFLLTEGEWGRVILESGPILGLAFLLWRTALVLKLGRLSLTQIKEGRILPIMLFGVGFLSLWNGQLGQPTNLGFAVFVCGLCLAAANAQTPMLDPEPLPPVPPPGRRVARRSAYAELLHSSAAAPPHPDDFAGR